MGEIRNSKNYDLEDRTLMFSKRISVFVKRLPKTLSNIEDGRRLIRSSGSVGSNYIEANESLGRKDLAMRIRICRKEAKESIYWQKLVDVGDNAELEDEREKLIREAQELMNIFGAILQRVK